MVVVWYLFVLAAAALRSVSANLEVSVSANVSMNQANIGDTVALTCTLTSANATDASYTWSHEGGSGDIAEQSNVLVLSEITLDQFGMYHCNVSSNGETGSASITITQAFVIGFETENYLTDEGRGRVTLVIRSSIPNPGPSDVILTIQTINGTALAGIDYRGVSDFVIFPPMEQVMEYDVEFFDDNIVEVGVETFSVVLDFAPGFERDDGLTLGITEAEVFLRDINTVTIQLDPTSIRVSEDSGEIVILVTKEGTAEIPTAVFIDTRDSTAAAATDYEELHKTIVFEPEEFVYNLTLSLVADSVLEEDESFQVELSIQEGAPVTLLDTSRSTSVNILNDDSVLFQFQSQQVFVTEGVNDSVTISVIKEGQHDFPLTISVVTTPLDATTGVDYDHLLSDLTFHPENDSLEVSVRVLDDDTVELPDRFVVLLTTMLVGTLIGEPRQVTVVIIDDDTIQLEFDQLVYSVTEGDEMVSLRVNKIGQSLRTVTFDLSTEDGTAIAMEDYIDFSDVLGIPPDDDVIQINLTIVNDNIPEQLESFFVELGSDIGTSVVEGRQRARVDVTDDDTGGEANVTVVSFVPSSYSILEGDGSVEVTIERQGPAAATEVVTVQYFTLPASASENSDFVPIPPTTATFSEGETAIRVTVPITDNNVLEEEELLFVRVELIGSPPGVMLGADTATILITDDDSVVVRWQPRDYVVTEPVGLVGLRITYEGQTDIDVTVVFTTQEEEADVLDFLNKTEEVTFDRNRNETFVSVDIRDDVIYEGSERFLATISPMTSGVRVDGGAASITIGDEEDFPVIFFDGEDAFETVEEGQGLMTVIVRKSTPNSIPVTVRIQTMDETATAPGDYVPISMDLTFGPSDEERVVNITIVEDEVLEFTESFQIVVTRMINGGQLAIPVDRLFVSILDSSPGISVGFESTEFTADESEREAVLTVVVSSELGRTIELMLTTEDGTAVAGDDYTETVLSFFFAPGESQTTVSVPLLNNDVLEGAEYFSVLLTANGLEEVAIVDSSANVTILDDDFITVLFDPVEYTVREDNGTVTLRLVKVGENDITASVTFNTEDRSAFGRIEQLDYVPVTQRVEFNPSDREQFITIDILDNNALEGVELFFGQLAIPSGETGVNLADDRASVFIVDEDVVVVSFSQPEYVATEGDQSVILTVIKTGESQVVVEAEFTVLDGTATGNLDYIPDSQVIQFDLREDTQLASVQIFDDGIYEGPEQFFGVLQILSNEPGILAPDNTTTITIQDNDFVTVSFDRVDYVVSETQHNLSLTISKQGAAVVPVTVTATTMETTDDNSATAGEDFEPVTMEVILLPNETSITIVIQVLNDNTLEGLEVFQVVLLGGAGVRITDGEATIQIIDEDAARLGFTETKYTVSEGDGGALVCIEKSAQVEFSFDVQVTTLPLTASNLTDFTPLRQSLAFSPTDQELCISATLINDEELEGNEEFQLTLELLDSQLEQEGRITVAPIITRVCITDDDAVTIELEEAQYTVREGENVTVRVLKEGESTIPTTVGIFLRPETAVAGVDYTPLLAQSLTFDPTEETKEVVISTISDEKVEDNEVFVVELVTQSGTGVVLGSVLSASVQILDNDVVTLSFEQSSYSVAESSGILSINITKTGFNDRPVSVVATIEEGSATTNRDFIPLFPEVITFRSGDDVVTLAVRIIDDPSLEFDEVLRVLLSPAPEESGVVLQDGEDTAVITIQDNDLVAVGILQEEIVVAEESTTGVQLQVVLISGLAERPFTLFVETTDDTAIGLSDYIPLSEDLVFMPTDFARLVSVQIINDSVVEPDEVFNVVLSVPADERGVRFEPNIPRLSTRILIEDDDILQIGFEESSYSFMEDVGLAVVNLFKQGQIERAVAVLVVVDNGSALSTTDYGGPVQSNLVFEPQDTLLPFSIPIIDDAILERTEDFVARLFASQSGVAVPSERNTATIEIIDNDFVTVGFGTPQITVSEGPVNVEVQVLLLEGVADIPFIVNIETNDGTARANEDYVPVSETLRFRPTETTKSITIPIIDDDIIESDKEFSIVLSSEYDRIRTNPATLTVRIIDTSDPLLEFGFEFTDVSVMEDESFVELVVVIQGGLVDTPLSLRVSTADGTATAPEDYQAIDTEIVFEARQQRTSIQINIVDDQVLEGREYFTVHLSGLFPFLSDAIYAVVGIVDNDVVTIGFERTEITVEETVGSEVQADVVLLEGVPERDFSVTAATIDGTAQAPNDYTPLLNYQTFYSTLAVHGFTIAIIQDDIVEPTEMFSVRLASTEEGVLVDPARSLLQVTITDQSDTVIGFEASDVRVGEGSPFVQLAVAIQGRSIQGSVTLSYTTVDETATAPEDYTGSSGTLTFTSTQERANIQIELNNDDIFERNDAFSVVIQTVNATVAAIVFPERATVTIVDDDDIVILSGGDVVTQEDSGMVAICFELNHPAELPLTVNVAFTAKENAASPAEGGRDFSDDMLLLVFNPGQVTSCVEVAIFSDDEVERDEEFCANIVSNDPRVLSAGGGGECDVTVTIQDTSEPPQAVCTVEDPVIVSPFQGLVSTQRSYNFHGTCEHTLLEDCNMNPSDFRITVDFTSSDLDMGRVGIALNEKRVVILEDLAVQTSNLGVPLSTSPDGSRVEYAGGITATEEDGLSRVELTELGVVVQRQRNQDANLLSVNVTREGSLSNVCGLCGTLNGVLLHSDRVTETVFVDRTELEMFADSWRVNPGEQFLREERRECGYLANDTVIGDPLFTVPLYDEQGSTPVIPMATNATPPALCFEIHGAADQIFNLVSDRCTSVNAHYRSMDIPDNGNIIGAVGIRAVDKEGGCVDVTVNLSNNCVPQITQGNVSETVMRYSSNGVSVSTHRDRVRVSVPNCEGVQLVMWVTCEEVQGQDMIKFVISRGINLRPSSHGLLGQFWNIPITFQRFNYTGPNSQRLSESFTLDRLYEITVHPPGATEDRTFVGELYHRSWDQKGVRCFYAGSGQGGSLGEFESPADSVIEGRYSEYRVSGLHETAFKYSQFSSMLCSLDPGLT